MSSRCLKLFSVSLLFAIATSASAQDTPGSRSAIGALPQGLEQAVYKGLVGNVLDAIPMDPLQRVSLQRTNAVVSNTFLGRSLTVLAGLSNPVLLLGGFVWGVWAASNIKPAEAVIGTTADAEKSADEAATQERLLALLAPATAADDAPAEGAADDALLVSLLADGGPVAAAGPNFRVVKIWLPQRSPMRQ